MKNHERKVYKGGLRNKITRVITWNGTSKNENLSNFSDQITDGGILLTPRFPVGRGLVPVISAQVAAYYDELDVLAVSILDSNQAPGTTYSIVGTLPAGLTFTDTGNIVTGATITGTISAGAFDDGPGYTVTITATGTYGTDSVQIIFTVLDPGAAEAAPEISYPSATYLLPIGTTISPIDPVSTGGTITSYSLTNGTIPVGLSLSATTGRISGNPQNPSGGEIELEITATGPGGDSAPAVVTLHIGYAPAPTYAGTPYSLTQNADLYVDADDPATLPTTYSIVSGSLPSGISLLSDGALSGQALTSGTSAARIQSANIFGSGYYNVDFTVGDIWQSMIDGLVTMDLKWGFLVDKSTLYKDINKTQLATAQGDDVRVITSIGGSGDLWQAGGTPTVRYEVSDIDGYPSIKASGTAVVKTSGIPAGIQAGNVVSIVVFRYAHTLGTSPLSQLTAFYTGDSASHVPISLGRDNDGRNLTFGYDAHGGILAADNDWHVIMYRHVGGGSVALYLDGVLFNYYNEAAYGSITEAWLGGSQGGTADSRIRAFLIFDGWDDDEANTILTTFRQMWPVLNDASSPIQQGLTAHWSLEEPTSAPVNSGIRFDDVSGKKFYVTAPTEISGEAPAATLYTTQGKLGSGVNFNSSDGFRAQLLCEDGIAQDLTADLNEVMHMWAWIYPSGNGDMFNVIRRMNYNGGYVNPDWTLDFITGIGATFSLVRRDDRFGHGSAFISHLLPINNWYFIEGYIQIPSAANISGVVGVAINGSGWTTGNTIATSQWYMGGLGSGDGYVTVGGWGDRTDRWANGIIDSIGFRVLNRVPSDNERRIIYASGDGRIYPFVLAADPPIGLTYNIDYLVSASGIAIPTLTATLAQGTADEYSIIAGVLPSGITINSTNGTISGIPTQSLTTTVTVKALNTASVTSDTTDIYMEIYRPWNSGNPGEGEGF